MSEEDETSTREGHRTREGVECKKRGHGRIEMCMCFCYRSHDQPLTWNGAGASFMIVLVCAVGICCLVHIFDYAYTWLLFAFLFYCTLHWCIDGSAFVVVVSPALCRIRDTPCCCCTPLPNSRLPFVVAPRTDRLLVLHANWH